MHICEKCMAGLVFERRIVRDIYVVNVKWLHEKGYMKGNYLRGNCHRYFRCISAIRRNLKLTYASWIVW